MSETRLLWHIPNKPENISIGRKRIADGLEDRGIDVTLTDKRGKHLKQQLRAGYDVLMSTSSVGGIFGPLGRIQGTTYIVDYVDPITQMYKSSTYTTARLAETLQDISFRSADAICYVYEEERDRVEQYGKPVTKTSLGVDYERFAEPSARSVEAADRILRQHETPRDFAVYIGGLEYIYNIPTLLDAAKLGKFELVIAGTGEYRPAVEDAATAYENITYLGLVDHEYIPGLLDRASVGMCLVDDPHTVKVLEYGAAGLPVVHVDGRARTELPDDVTYTSADPLDVSRAVFEALGGRDVSALNSYAANHSWSGVVDDYAGMLARVQ